MPLFYAKLFYHMLINRGHVVKWIISKTEKFDRLLVMAWYSVQSRSEHEFNVLII